MINGIDVSKHNGSIDFDRVKNAGIEVVIMRCGYGKEVSQKDEKLDEYYNSANGKFKLATYLYSYANSVDGAKLEANNTLKLIEGKKFDYIFYDLEDKNAENLSKEVITDMYFAYKEIIENAGYRCGIYCNKSWATNKVDMAKITDMKWIAAYGSNDGNVPADSTRYSECDIWQYTDKGKVDGVSGDVDLNIIYNWENFKSSGDVAKPEENIDTTVQEIQKTLNERYGLSIAIDNIFGKETKKALIIGLQTELNNQYNKGLIVDGIWGTKTKDACVNVKKGARGNITYILQAILFCRGYNTNGVDGIFGSGTESAVKQFQKANGLEVDGIAGKNTFRKLFGG